MASDEQLIPAARPNRKRLLWGSLAVLTCPCHIPILIFLFSGTAFGAFLSDHIVVAVVVLVVLFLICLGAAMRLPVHDDG